MTFKWSVRLFKDQSIMQASNFIVRMLSTRSYWDVGHSVSMIMIKSLNHSDSEKCFEYSHTFSKNITTEPKVFFLIKRTYERMFYELILKSWLWCMFLVTINTNHLHMIAVHQHIGYDPMTLADLVLLLLHPTTRFSAFRGGKFQIWFGLSMCPGASGSQTDLQGLVPKLSRLESSKFYDKTWTLWQINDCKLSPVTLPGY